MKQDLFLIQAKSKIFCKLRYLKLFYCWKREIQMDLWRKCNQSIKLRILCKSTTCFEKLRKLSLNTIKHKYFGVLKISSINSSVVKGRTMRSLVQVKKYLILLKSFSQCQINSKIIMIWRCATRFNIPFVINSRIRLLKWRCLTIKHIRLHIFIKCFLGWKASYINNYRKRNDLDLVIMKYRHLYQLSSYSKFKILFKRQRHLKFLSQQKSLAHVFKEWMKLTELRTIRIKIANVLVVYVKHFSACMKIESCKIDAYHLLKSIFRIRLLSGNISTKVILRCIANYSITIMILGEYKYIRKYMISNYFVSELFKNKDLSTKCQKYLIKRALKRIFLSHVLSRNKRQSEDLKKNIYLEKRNKNISGK